MNVNLTKYMVTSIWFHIRILFSLTLLCAMPLSTGCTKGVSTGTCVHSPDVTSDNLGGAIAVYQVRKARDARELYAQKVNSEGVLLWGEKGALIDGGYGGGCGELLRIVNDGYGGAVLAWRAYPTKADLESPTGEQMQPVVTVIRIDSQGRIQWQKEVNQVDRVEHMISDDLGGVIIACDDYHSRSIYLQKIDAEGGFPWGRDGVTMYFEEYQNDSLQLMGDGSGGAILTWQESHANPGAEMNQPEATNHIFAQRVNPYGDISWGKDGVLLYATAREISQTKVTSDGSGGAIVVWRQSNPGSPKLYDICVQRVDAGGNILWQEGAPVFVRSQMERAADPILTNDGSGGVIVFWESHMSIYAQRLDSSGKTLWPEDGIQVWQRKNGTRLTCSVVSDGSGGAIVAWWYLAGTRVDKGELLRVQRLDANGRAIWMNDGIPVAIAIRDYCNHAAISQDGLGGVLIAFGVGRDVYTVEKSYVQRVDAKGNPLWGEKGIRLSP